MLSVSLVSAADTVVTNRYEKDIIAIEKRFAQENYPTGGIIFVGSSTIRLWDLKKYFPDMTLPNCGFGGAIIRDQLFYYKRLVVSLKPRHVVFYDGGNDLTTGLTRSSFKGFQELD